MKTQEEIIHAFTRSEKETPEQVQACRVIRQTYLKTGLLIISELPDSQVRKEALQSLLGSQLLALQAITHHWYWKDRK